jgi:hypothetical protein
MKGHLDRLTPTTALKILRDSINLRMLLKSKQMRNRSKLKYLMGISQRKGKLLAQLYKAVWI